MAIIVSEATTSESSAVEIADEDSNEATDNNPVVDVEEVMSIMSAASLSAKEEPEILHCEEQNADSSPTGLGSSADVVMLGDTTTVTTATVTEAEMTVSVNSSAVAPLSLSTSPMAPATVTENEDLDVEVKKELVENEVSVTPIQKRFCPEEDKVLKAGIIKHGLGKWSIMLKDKTLNFHTSRTRHALRMRAQTLGLSGRRKSKRNNVVE